MANEAHLLLSAIGSYTLPALQPETWAVNVRLTLVDGPVDPVGTLPNNWAPIPATVNRAETDWTITSNWKILGPPPDQFSPDDYLNDQAAPAFTTWMGAVGLASLTRLEMLKLFPIGTNGKAIPAPPYSQGSPCLLTWTANNPVGGGSANVLPLQVAAVLSHKTSQLGRRGRGRMFLPGLPFSSTDNAARFTTGFQTSAVAAQVALLEALAYSAPLPGQWHLRPSIIGKPWTNYAIISRVQADNIPDTQRRRRRSLPPTVVGSDVSY